MERTSSKISEIKFLKGVIQKLPNRDLKWFLALRGRDSISKKAFPDLRSA